MKRNHTLFLTRAAMTAALYVALSLLSNSVGLCSGVIQCRISEALTILPAFLAEAIPGLYIGCLLTNILTSGTYWDILFGPLATLLGAMATFLIGLAIRSRARRAGKPDPLSSSVETVPFTHFLLLVFLFAFPPVAANMVIIPPILQKTAGATEAFWYLALTVGAGEVIACGILGGILLWTLLRTPSLKRLLLRPAELR